MIRSPFPDVDVPDVPLTDFVLANAERLSDKPALIDATTDRTVTYAQLAESVRAMAAGLAGRGFGKGDTFAHFAPNLPEYAIACTGWRRSAAEHDRQPVADRAGARGPAARLRRADAGDRAGAARQGGRSR